jgi:hypothetical protein
MELVISYWKFLKALPYFIITYERRFWAWLYKNSADAPYSLIESAIFHHTYYVCQDVIRHTGVQYIDSDFQYAYCNRLLLL